MAEPKARLPRVTVGIGAIGAVARQRLQSAGPGVLPVGPRRQFAIDCIPRRWHHEETVASDADGKAGSDYQLQIQHISGTAVAKRQ